LLDVSDAALHGTNGGAPSQGSATPKSKRKPKGALADSIATVLRPRGAMGLAVKEVAAELAEMGYHDKGNTKLITAVGPELYRQDKHGRRGIRKIGPGRYALIDTSQVED